MNQNLIERGEAVKVTVPLHSDPLVREKLTLHEDGKKKTYLVAKKWINPREILYILPDDFPLCMVNVLFGVEAKIEELPRRKKWKIKIPV